MAEKGWTYTEAPGGQTPPPAPKKQAPAGAPLASQGITNPRKVAAAATVMLILVAATVGTVIWFQLSGKKVDLLSGAPKVALTQTKEVLSDVVGTEGAFFDVQDAASPIFGTGLDIPAGAIPDSASVSIGYTQDDVAPDGTRGVTPQVHIDTEGLDQFGVPARVSVPVDLSGVQDVDNLIPLVYDRATSTWDAAPVASHAPINGTVEIDTVEPSVVIYVVEAEAPLQPSETRFDADRHGWGVADTNTYLTPGGDSMGMCVLSKWTFKEGTTGPAGMPADVQDALAPRTQMAINDQWRGLSNEGRLTQDAAVGIQVAGLIQVTHYPQILLMGTGPGAEHAVLATGYDGTGFEVYDPAVPGEVQHIAFEASFGFAAYEGYTHFGFAAPARLAADSTFAGVYKGAADGTLTEEGQLTLTSPNPGQEVTGGLVQVAGQVEGSLADAPVAVIYVGSDRFEAAISGGQFSLQVPVNQVGDVDIMVLAGGDDPERSPDAVAATVQVTRAAGVAMLVTLTWDQDGTDVDLYVHEPDGETAYYNAKTTSTGGELDVDDTSGLGPEHYTLDPSESDVVEPGVYTVRVHYFRGTGTVTGTVDIVTYGEDGVPESTRVPFSITTANGSNAAPGSSGPDWAEIGGVRLT